MLVGEPNLFFAKTVIDLVEQSLLFGHYSHNDNSNCFAYICPQQILCFVWADNTKFEKAIDWIKVDKLVLIIQAVAGVRI